LTHKSIKRYPCMFLLRFCSSSSSSSSSISRYARVF
jgi:hypothetical protein